MTLLVVMIVGSPTIMAQYPGAAPTPDPEIQKQREWQDIRRRLDDLERIGVSSNSRRRVISDGPADVLRAQYRRSSLEELRLLAPDESDKAKYAKFLRQRNTGMLRLVTDLGCDEYSVRTPATGICERFSMPGGGSAYSFRQIDYQLWKLADLLYDGKSFFAFGEMSQGFLIDLGNKPLKDLTRTTKGANYPFVFVPSSDPTKSSEENKQFVEGIRLDGFEYKKVLPAVEGNTYILRSVAYNGNAPRIDRGLTYNELEYDKRKDVVIGFTVIRRDFNGTVTLLWKILETKASPVLK
jgi:hypothetical protein